MQSNCLECSTCYDFEGTGAMVSLCQEPECGEQSELCRCGDAKSEHFDEERDIKYVNG